jgi:hypothetical protein
MHDSAREDQVGACPLGGGEQQQRLARTMLQVAVAAARG